MPDPVEAPRPVRALREIGQQYPKLWDAVDRIRAAPRTGGLERWPQHVFIPMFGIYAYLLEFARARGRDLDSVEVNGPTIPMLQGLASWRVTQGIYDFEPGVFEELWHTPITGQLPTRVLYHLPEWCCYIRFPYILRPMEDVWATHPTPHRSLEAIGNEEISAIGIRDHEGVRRPWQLHGFFVYHEWTFQEAEPSELRILLDVESWMPNGKINNILVPQAVPLGPWDLEESCLKALQISVDRARDLGKTLTEIEDITQMRTSMASLNAPLLSLTLYLCSLASELRCGVLTRPIFPTVTKTKRGPRMFPPQQPKVWTVAERLGAALRLARQAEASSTPGTPEGSAQRLGPRPHIRRAHWATYWVGKGRTTARINWLNPILVGASTPDDLIPASHPVD